MTSQCVVCKGKLPKFRQRYCSDECYKIHTADREKVDHTKRTCHYFKCDNPIPGPPRKYCSKEHSVLADAENKAQRLRQNDPELAWHRLIKKTDGFDDCEKAIEADRTGRAPLPQPTFVARKVTS